MDFLVTEKKKKIVEILTRTRGSDQSQPQVHRVPSQEDTYHTNNRYSRVRTQH